MFYVIYESDAESRPASPRRAFAGDTINIGGDDRLSIQMRFFETQEQAQAFYAEQVSAFEDSEEKGRIERESHCEQDFSFAISLLASAMKPSVIR